MNNVLLITGTIARSTGPLATYRKLWTPNIESIFTYISTDVLGAIKKSNLASSSNLGHPLKMVADVKVQSFSDKTLRVKLDHVRFYSNGNQMNLTSAHQILETGIGQGGSMDHTEQTFKKFLEEPMLAYTKRGLIKKLIVSQYEPSEVTELKRLLVSKLEMSKVDASLKLIKKQAIITPLETPRNPRTIDLGNYGHIAFLILQSLYLYHIYYFYKFMFIPFSLFSLLTTYTCFCQNDW